jgi:hypothetical protein
MILSLVHNLTSTYRAEQLRVSFVCQMRILIKYSICFTAPSFSVTLPDTEAGEVAAPVRLPNVFR